MLPHSPWTLGQAWAASLHQTKMRRAAALSNLAGEPVRWRSSVAICFLVPTLPLLVRMRDEGTHNKSGVDRLEMWLYRGLRLGLLLACFWLAFDPGPGARQVMHQLGIRLPLLTFDYLNALGAAFLVGNLLLISQPVVRDQYRRSRNKIPWRRLAVPIATAGLAVVAVGLAVRNAPAIWRMNHHPLEQFGDLAVKSLPAGRRRGVERFPGQTDGFSGGPGDGSPARRTGWRWTRTRCRQSSIAPDWNSACPRAG